MATHSRNQSAAREDSEQRASLLPTVCDLVFVCLPLSVQAITVPALSKAWKRWAEEQRAKERLLEQAERVAYTPHQGYDTYRKIHVPLWAALQHPGLSLQQRQRFGGVVTKTTLCVRVAA